MRRAWLILVILLATVGVVAAYFALRGPRDTFLAGVVPPDFELPELRVPGSAAWHQEEWKIVVLQSEAGVQWHLSFDADDGGPRVRGPGDEQAYGEMPWPAGLEADAALGLEGKVQDLLGAPDQYLSTPRRPAVAWCGGPDLRWSSDLAGIFSDRYFAMPRLYMVGRDRDGSVGALPFFVNAPRGLFNSVGVVVHLAMMRDIQGHKAFLEVRITRRGDTVRYRWGHFPDWGRQDRKRWSLGDRSFPAAEVRAGGEGPLIPDLAGDLERLIPSGVPYRLVVSLQTSPEIRTVDVLRAMECGAGDPRVLWFLPVNSAYGFYRLPDPGPAAARADLVEVDAQFGQFHIVNLRPDGVVQDRGDIIEVDALTPLRGGATFFWLRAMSGAPWATARKLLVRMHARGIDAALTAASEPLWPEFERMLRLPVPPEGSDAERIEAAPDATIDDVLPKLVERRAAGVRYFRFD